MIMNKKTYIALFLVIVLLLSCVSPVLADAAQEEQYPILSELNPYVVKADVKSYLSDLGMEGYIKLVDAVLARETKVKLSNDFDTNLHSFGALQGNPFCFFVEKLTFTDKNTAVKLTYKFTGAEQKAMYDFIVGEYLSILNEIIKSDMNELDKALAVYHYFATRIEYDYDWLDEFRATEDRFLYPDIAIYQALASNRGVCHSYTYLCEFAYQQIGIECLRFTGVLADDEDEGHMWLVVRIDGQYYHCDPTWDRQGDQVGLRYFGMTDAERRESGIVNFDLSYDATYGDVVCDSTIFSDFRTVQDFHFTDEPHKIYVDMGWMTGEYDTAEMKIVE